MRISSTKRVLAVAGSDSSGGAGLEADQKVIAAHGCYAMTATTALTAQNTKGVQDIYETPSAFVKKQIDACIDDVGVDVLKTGMLASEETVKVVADAIQKHGILISVIDPVMVSTSGHELLPNSAIKTLCNTLIPLATLVTPNIPEAHLMLQEADMPAIDVDDLDGLKQLAIAVRRLGAKHVLLKGGHLPLDSDHKVARSDSRKKIVCNVLCTGDAVEILEFPFSPSKNTHGTGCSLASAIACNLALGHTMLSSVRSACRYVDAGIRTAPSLGTGSGPINHFHSLQRLPFTPGAFVEYLLERDDVVPAWRAFTHHEFVEHMGDGTLEPERYKYYMIQDYLYLRHFARANALAGYKSKDLADVARAAEIVLHIQQETKLHVGECAALGVTQEEMETFEEHQACTAYTRYVLDIGQSEDWLALQISLLPCLLGYAVIAKRLLEAQAKREAEGKGENRYGKWIRNYVAEDYTQAVQKGCGLIEKHAVKHSPDRIEELVKIFIHATKMETGFWNMASTGV